MYLDLILELKKKKDRNKVEDRVLQYYKCISNIGELIVDVHKSHISNEEAIQLIRDQLVDTRNRVIELEIKG